MARRRPFRPFHALNGLGRKHPVLLAGAFVSARYVIGDSAVQLNGAGNGATAWNQWNQRRTAAFGLFGFTYGSTCGYFFYNKVYPRVFGASRPVLAAVTDVLTQTPFLYFPMFYIVREGVYKGPREALRHPLATARSGIAAWKSNFLEDFKMTLAFWLPAHLFNFKYLPLHMRMPFIGTLGLAWTMGLSTYRSGDAVEREGTEDLEAFVAEPEVPKQRRLPGWVPPGMRMPTVLGVSLASATTSSASSSSSSSSSSSPLAVTCSVTQASGGK
jgi:hypothetical protein